MTKDHDLLIRIDERMTAMSEDYARQGDITTAITEHCLKSHGKKSIPPGPRKIDWGLVKMIALILSALLTGGGAVQIASNASANETETQKTDK